MFDPIVHSSPFRILRVVFVSVKEGIAQEEYSRVKNMNGWVARHTFVTERHFLRNFHYPINILEERREKSNSVFEFSIKVKFVFRKHRYNNFFSILVSKSYVWRSSLYSRIFD